MIKWILLQDLWTYIVCSTHSLSQPELRIFCILPTLLFAEELFTPIALPFA